MKKIDICEIQKRRYETFEKEKANLLVTKVGNSYEVSNLGKATTYRVSKNPDTGKVECACRDYQNYREYDLRCKHKIAVIMKFSKAANNKTIKAEDNNIKNNEEVMNVSNNMNNQVNNEAIVLKEILNRPFTAQIIKQRDGQKGKKLNYVETVHYIDRLNEAFNFQWNWEIVSEVILVHEVYCKGKLSVEIGGKTVIKEAYGGKDLTIVDTYDKQTRQVVGKKPFSIADDLKSASSDALKKACSLLGIGLHLYKPQQAPQNMPQNHPVRANHHTAPAPMVRQNTTAPAITSTAPPAPIPAAPKSPSVPTTQKPTTQPVNSSGTRKGGNGKNGNGSGEVDINNIIRKW